MATIDLTKCVVLTIFPLKKIFYQIEKQSNNKVSVCLVNNCFKIVLQL